MLILGVTADDKGAPVESLIRKVLQEQGYTKITSNVVGAGGNQLDVTAARESILVTSTQLTPLMCEAKAYSDPVNMPTWQKFLGKLFIERKKDSTAIGMLVALNGINGNVTGSYADLQKNDTALLVFDGNYLAVARDRVGRSGNPR